MQTTLLCLRPVSAWRDFESPTSRDLHSAVIDQIELVFLRALGRWQFNRANLQRIIGRRRHARTSDKRAKVLPSPSRCDRRVVRRAVDIEQPRHQLNAARRDRATRVLHRQNERGQRYVVGVGPGCGVAGRRIGSGCCGNRSRSATGRDGRLRAEFADGVVGADRHG